MSANTIQSRRTDFLTRTTENTALNPFPRLHLNLGLLSPRKRHHRKNESKESYRERIKEWEALLPHEAEVKPKGNTMTQKYYVERLLLVYTSAI